MRFLEAIKRIRLRVKILLGLILLSGIGLFVLFVISQSIANNLYDQSVSKQWNPGSGSAHVSLFFEEDKSSDISRYYSICHLLSEDYRVALNGKYPFNESESLFPGPFTGAYSAEGKLSIATVDDRVSGEFRAMGIGGDFFLFHPIRLEEGRYLSPDEMNNDGLVIDSYTAWRLFGSYDVIGMPVSIGTGQFYIRGVYQIEEDELSKMTGFSDGYVFMDYDALKQYGHVGSIACMEFVGEDPFEGNMYELLSDPNKLGIDVNSFEVVNNASRFSLGNRLNVLTDMSKRVMRRNAITYPYWENKARAVENTLSTLLVFEAVLLMLLVALLIILLVDIYRHRSWSIKILLERMDLYFYRHRTRNRKDRPRGGISEK